MKRHFKELKKTKLKKVPHRVARAVKHDVKALTPLRAIEGVALLLLIIQFVVVGANLFSANKPVAGVRLEGYKINAAGEKDFRKKVDAIIYEWENKQFPVKVTDKTSHISLRQLGVKTDKEKVYNSLLTIGRSGNIASMLAEQNQALFGMRDVSLEAKLNDKLAKRYITTLNKKVKISPVNAHFAYKHNEVVVVADKKGRTINTDAALNALRHAKPVQATPTVLPTEEVEAKVSSSLLRTILPQAKAIAQKPLTIKARDNTVSLSRQQLLELIVPKLVTDPKRNDKKTMRLTFNESKVNAVVDKLLKPVVTTPEPTIMNGNSVTRQGKNGLQPKDDHPQTHVLAALVQRQTKASMPTEVSIPLTVVKAPVQHATSANPTTRTGSGLVRLTFDDGPTGHTHQILDILARYNVHATFYVIGRYAAGGASTLQRIKNEGHRIGNHTFNHANLTTLSAEGVRQEIASTQVAIQQASGVTPTAFRPPYGAVNQTVYSVAGSMGLSVDLWSVDTVDWSHPGSGVIAQRALAGTGPGAVILMHDTSQQTVDALPSIIEGVRAQGYTLE